MFRPQLAGAAIAVVLLASFALQCDLVGRTGFLAGDFRAFYCAAKVATHGADPYRTESLHSCEVSVGSQTLFEKEPHVTVPAPLPGYAIAAFVPLTLLPFAAAAAVWIVALAFLTVAAAIYLARTAAIGWPAALAILGVSVGIASIPFGEIVPVAVGAICACGYFAARERWRAATNCAAIAMIEPHLGLPVCLALMVWAPPARFSMAIRLAALGVFSLATLGVATNVEYFAHVLPAHALSEAARDTQFSLTSVLTSLGIRDAIAARIGFIEYLAMLAIGTYAAGALARRSGDRAFLAYLPPAFAVFGGTFIHVTQIAAALPAAVLSIAHLRGSTRTVVVIALLLLAVPWIMAWSPALGLAPLVPVAYVVWTYSGNVRAVLTSAVVAALLVLGANRLVSQNATAVSHYHPQSSIDPAFAEASWGDFSQKSSTGSAGAWLLRIPTWGGLAVLLAVVLGEAVPRRRAPAATAE